MRWTGHATRMGVMRNKYNILVTEREGKRSLEDLGLNGRII
jgi:hypothetical protein